MLVPVPRLALAALVALAASVSGCNLVDKLTNDSPTGPTPTPPTATEAIAYTALGASDALGYGGSVVCAPLSACPSGTGYVPVLVRRLQATRQVTVLNLGIPGAVLSPAVETLGRQQGRDIPGNLIDREMPFITPTANLVTVFVGGNDTNAVGAAIAGGAAGRSPSATERRAYIDAQVRDWGTAYRTLVAGIRARAPGAYVLLLNVPNMAALPYAQRYPPLDRQVLQQIAVGFAKQVNARAGPGVGVVDVMCDAQMYDRSRLSGDGFHPNDAGYARLADLLQRALDAGGPAPPLASCAQMSVVSGL